MSAFPSFALFLKSLLVLSFVCAVALALCEGSKSAPVIKFACSLALLAFISASLISLFAKSDNINLPKMNIEDETSETIDYSLYKASVTSQWGNYSSKRLRALIEEKFALEEGDFDVAVRAAYDEDGAYVEKIEIKVRTLKALLKKEAIESYVRALSIAEDDNITVSEDILR